MFERLPGFRDFYPEDCARRNHLFRLWTLTARRFGFVQYDIPTLEPLELFTEKSGPEIVSQLFNFTDKGGRQVALRPELTPSLARMVGSKANSLKRPVKWFNIAENFRYEKQQKGRLRSHYQYNCDIYGEPGVGADIELIAVCLESLRALGLTENDLILRLSDRDLWMAYLAGLGHEGEAALGILGIIDKLERNPDEESLKLLEPYFGDAREDFLAQVKTLISLRDFAEVETFLLAQATNPASRDRMASRLAELKALVDGLVAFGLKNFFRLDLGIVRGLAYYTGFVFEIFELEDGALTGRALAGGGRYDHLVEKLGYSALPAVGFGMGDVTMTDLLEKKGLFPTLLAGPDVYVVIGGDSERPAALEDIGRLRQAGVSVEYPLKGVGFGKQFKTAGQSGARFALVYGGDEVARGVVKAKDLGAGTEIELPREQLTRVMPDLLAEGIPPLD
jgi:histidyl-tRNA synthetase